MKIFKDKHSLQRGIFKEKGISFVPTMGGLHSGHLSLIKKGKEFGGQIITSIFINPLQFNNKKDLYNYPKTQMIKSLNKSLFCLPIKNPGVIALTLILFLANSLAVA